jgi:hypothetical protein
MKKILLITFIFLYSIFYSANGKIDFDIAKNFESENSDIYQLIKTDIINEFYSDNSFFKYNISFSLLNGISNEQLQDNAYIISRPDFTFEIPSMNLLSTYLISNISFREVFYDFYSQAFNLRIGRFDLNTGTGLYYSPSTNLQANDYKGVFTNDEKIPMDGLKIQGFLNDIALEGYFTAVNKYDNPDYKSKQELLIFTEKSKKIMTFEPTMTISKMIDGKNSKISYEDLNLGIKGNINFFGINTTIGYYRDHYHFKLPQDINLNMDRTNNKVRILLNGEINSNDPMIGPIIDGMKIKDTIDASGMIIDTIQSTSTLYTPYRNIITLDLEGTIPIDGFTWHLDSAYYIPQKKESIYRTNYTEKDSIYEIDITFESTPTKTDEDNTDTIIKQKNYIENFKTRNYSENKKFFKENYFKYVFGLEYMKNDFTIGIEYFNSLSNQHFKFTPGISPYISYKNSDFDIQFGTLIGFDINNSKITPAYTFTGDIKYIGEKLFEVGFSFLYTLIDDKTHPMYTNKQLNGIKLQLTGYF